SSRKLPVILRIASLSRRESESIPTKYSLDEAFIPQFRESALLLIAKKALERKTGARGLRSILEHSLLDIMYELPSLENLSKVVIDESVVRGDTPAILIYADKPVEEAVG
ncbi:MAG: ATP-dependent Clp protease ATP-binding subunit ClpX, partial [Betaproteobacteria bacterium HGW-Betaproteobacteria-20]